MFNKNKKISRKQIKQAEKEVQCLVMFAHHEYMEPEYFRARLDDDEVLFAMSVCHFCGKVAVHNPYDFPE
jgi:hypothetical protein